MNHFECYWCVVYRLSSLQHRLLNFLQFTALMSLSYTLLPRAHCISVHHHRRIQVKGAEARRSFYLRWGQLLIDIVFRTALQTDFLGLLVAGSEVLYLCFSLSCVLVLVAAVMLLLAAADLLWRSTGRGNELSWRRRLWSCNHVARNSAGNNNTMRLEE